MYFAVERCNSYDICGQLASAMLGAAHLKWMALVDGAFDLDTKRVTEWPGKELLFRYSGYEDVLHVSPYLINLQVDNAGELKKQLRMLVDHRGNRPMLSFLSSKHSGADICSQWKNLVKVSVDDEQEFILRFADTRILEILPACLSPNIWAGLSNMLESWFYINRLGKLSPLPVSELVYSKTDKIELNKLVFDALVDKCEPDAIIDFLYRNQSELLEHTSPYLVYTRMQAVSEFARRTGITRFPDVVALATFDLVSETPVEKNMKVEALISYAEWIPGSLINSLADIME